MFTIWRLSSSPATRCHPHLACPAGKMPAAPSPSCQRLLIVSLWRCRMHQFSRSLAELAAGIMAQHFGHGGLKKAAQAELADVRNGFLAARGVRFRIADDLLQQF